MFAPVKYATFLSGVRFLLVLVAIIPLWFSPVSAQTSTKQLITKQYGLEEGLPSLTIYQLFQDSRGVLWLATDLGVVRFDGHQMETFSEKDGLFSGSVLGIAEDPKGNVWFHGFSRELAWFDPSSEKIHYPDWNAQLKAKAKGIYARMEFTPKGILLSGRVSAIYSIDTTRSPALVKLEHDDLDGLTIKEMAIGNFVHNLTRKNSFPHQLNLLLKNQERITVELPDNVNTKLNNVIWSKRKQAFVLNTVSGLVELERDGTFRYYKKTFRATESLYEDKLGNIWCGSFKQGVFCYPNGRLDLPPRQYFPGTMVRDILHDQNRAWWFSVAEKGLFYTWDIESESFLQADDQPVNVSDLIVRGDSCFVVHKLQKVGLLTQRSKQLHLEENIGSKSTEKLFHCGCYLYSHPGQFIPLKPDCNLAFSDSISSLSRLVCNEKTTMVINRKKIGDQAYLSFPSSGKMVPLAINSVRRLYLTQNDNIYYLDGQNNLFFIDVQAGTIELIDDEVISKREMQHVTSPDGDSLLIAFPYLGVCLLHRGEVVRLFNPFPNSSPLINCIFPVSDSTLWLGTNEGVWSTDYFGSEAQLVINRDLGLNSDQVNSIAFFGQHALFGTGRGLSAIPKRLVRKSARNPQVQIRKVESHNQQFPTSEPVLIPYDFEQLEIQFSATSFQNALHIPYRYRLSEEQDWIETPEGNLQLSNLAPGRYLLEIQARNAHLNWGKSSYLNIQIAEPFWKELWFTLLVFMVSVSLLITFLYWRFLSVLNKVRLEKAVFEAQNQSLVAHLKPHFISNAMNTVVSFITRNDSKSSLRFLSNLAALMRSVFENSQHSFIPLQEELNALKLYLEIQQSRFENFTYEISVDEALDLTTEKVPPLLLQPLVENAIIHGLKNEKDGKIKLILKRELSHIALKVRNTGKAYYSDQQSVDDQSKSSVSLIKKRLEMMEKTSGWAVKLQIGPIDSPPFVTEASLHFPIIKDL